MARETLLPPAPTLPVSLPRGVQTPWAQKMWPQKQEDFLRARGPWAVPRPLRVNVSPSSGPRDAGGGAASPGADGTPVPNGAHARGNALVCGPWRHSGTHGRQPVTPASTTRAPGTVPSTVRAPHHLQLHNADGTGPASPPGLFPSGGWLLLHVPMDTQKVPITMGL